MTPFRFVLLALCVVTSSTVWADGPADNQWATVRQVPPPGVMIDPADREALEGTLKTLTEKIVELRASKSAIVQTYLPDVEIFARAVKIALEEDGFFDPSDAKRAKDVLAEGLTRAEALAKEETPWRMATGTVVRGFRSKLDGSVQPYGIVYQPAINAPLLYDMRADIWCRGRSEKGLELQFIAQRMTSASPEPANGVMMIHPFGRYCNANKLAGEVDTLEVLEHALSQYPIDPQRVAIRGFSMGGAAAWHLAVHYPDKWFAANPGAGFSETPDFLKVFQKEELKPYPFEKTLWQMYDCPVWARNLRMLPTIAYSGEDDIQKQAADIMAAACWGLPEGERFELSHIIAPKTAHSITPAARAKIEKRLAVLDDMRSSTPPRSVSFATTTLKYDSSHWIKVHALQEHWKPSRIIATWNPEFNNNGTSHISVQLENINEFSIEFATGDAPFMNTSQSAKVTIASPITEPQAERIPEGDRKVNDLPLSQEERVLQGVEQAKREMNKSVRAVENQMWQRQLETGQPIYYVRFQGSYIPLRSDKSWGARFCRNADGTWELVSPIEPPSKDLVKKHNLQGPIDDALMSPFLFVKPTAAGRHPEVDKWVDAEFNRAVREWHRQMRGDARVKTSEELKPEDIENYHLILWGDPQSNPTIAKVADKLPIQWGAEQITVGEQKFDAKSHAPVLIYPNPLNPEKYVVLNSSFTYREYDYLNNARQVPKLPDWAIIDLSTPPDARWPGKVAAGDFFGEKWELKVQPTRE